MEQIKNKKRVFFFHYNKPASLSAKKPQITLHYKGQCHLIDNLIINVNTYGHIRNSQPRFVVKGTCNEVIFNDGVATII